MNIYEARWRNAQKVGRRIQSLLDRGYVVRDSDDAKVVRMEVTDRAVYQVLDGGCRVIWFENDKEWDHGLFTSIAEWNAKFASWTYYKPSAARPVIRHTKEIKHELAKPSIFKSL